MSEAYNKKEVEIITEVIREKITKLSKEKAVFYSALEIKARLKNRFLIANEFWTPETFTKMDMEVDFLEKDDFVEYGIKSEKAITLLLFSSDETFENFISSIKHNNYIVSYDWEINKICIYFCK